MQRRSFLASVLAASVLPQLSWADAGDPAYLAAAQTADGAFALHGLSLAGESLFALPLPARGHAATAHPTRPLAVAFARRPGTFALVIDCALGQETARLTPPAGRQFNGHGTFSADGARLYTSEVVAETSEGRLGIWDTASWQRIGECATHGVGPHDVKRLPLSEDLLVANGGIQTDPTDRTKLNIATMRPNLARLGPDGALISLAEAPEDLAQNSLRHLALLPDGRAAVATQWEGDPAEAPPLLALWEDGRLTFCPVPEAEMLVMQNYAGSIAYCPARAEIAITSPKGGAVQVFDAAGRFRATHRRADACGVAPAPAGFTVTDGNGAISTLGAAGLQPATRLDVKWDNHLIALDRG